MSSRRPVLVVAMAGESSRFAAEQVHVPKWALRLRGASLLEWSLSSLGPLLPACQVRLACRAQDLALVRSLLPSLPVPVHVEPLLGPRQGQAGDACRALEGVGDDQPLLVWNADTILDPPPALPSSGSWMLLTRKRGHEWGFAKVSGQMVVAAAERSRVGPWVAAGLYGFASVGLFRAQVTQALVPGQECPVTPLFNTLAAEGEPVRAVQVPSRVVQVVGTPAQMRAVCARRGWSLPEELRAAASGGTTSHG